ncbi:MAG: cyclic pyranopterin monophosphate synthase MoaC [Planctomycetota bacterium]
MVDVSSKNITLREASACGVIEMLASSAEMVRKGDGKKGDVLSVARLAAIGGVKWTQHLIPLCHAIPIEAVSVEFSFEDRESNEPIERLRCTVTARTSGKTGVEMEAMTGASIALLTVYDMIKSIDRHAWLGEIRLLSKSGGKSGQWNR